MYYIYHIPARRKIGATKQIYRRMGAEGHNWTGPFEILEQHTDLEECSRRERELQIEYGYEVDSIPYTESLEHRNKDEVQRKLTYEQAEEIRRRYENGGVSQASLAREYNVAQPAIFRIIHRKTYVLP